MIYSGPITNTTSFFWNFLYHYFSIARTKLAFFHLRQVTGCLAKKIFFHKNNPMLLNHVVPLLVILLEL